MLCTVNDVARLLVEKQGLVDIPVKYVNNKPLFSVPILPILSVELYVLSFRSNHMLPSSYASDLTR